MTPFFPLEELRKIPGFANVRYEDPYSGGQVNSMRYLGMSPRDDTLTIACAELLGTVMIISIIVALAKMLEETGIAERLFVPVQMFFSSSGIAFWVLGVISMIAAGVGLTAFHPGSDFRSFGLLETSELFA